MSYEKIVVFAFLLVFISIFLAIEVILVDLTSNKIYHTRKIFKYNFIIAILGALIITLFIYSMYIQ